MEQSYHSSNSNPMSKIQISNLSAVNMSAGVAHLDKSTSFFAALSELENITHNSP